MCYAKLNVAMLLDDGRIVVLFCAKGMSCLSFAQIDVLDTVLGNTEFESLHDVSLDVLQSLRNVGLDISHQLR